MTLDRRGLQQERERLLARCDELRRRTGETAQPIERRIAAADQLLCAVRINPLTGALLVGAGLAIASRLDVGLLARMVSLYALLKRA